MVARRVNEKKVHRAIKLGCDVYVCTTRVNERRRKI